MDVVGNLIDVVVLASILDWFLSQDEEEETNYWDARRDLRPAKSGIHPHPRKEYYCRNWRCYKRAIGGKGEGGRERVCVCVSLRFLFVPLYLGIFSPFLCQRKYALLDAQSRARARPRLLLGLSHRDWFGSILRPETHYHPYRPCTLETHLSPLR